MKRTSALVEFVLTTAVLGFWALACVAAFEATTSAPTPSADSAVHLQTLSAGTPSSTAQPATVEAALDIARRDAAADRI